MRPRVARPRAAVSQAESGRRLGAAFSRGWLVNPRRACGDPSTRKRAFRPAGRGEHARLSAGAGGLLGRRDGVGRREEPPRYESGFRAHGSNQRFHRLLRHAVARALTTAPSLAGVCPAALEILTPQGWRRNAARDAVAQTRGVVMGSQLPVAPTPASSAICRAWSRNGHSHGRVSRPGRSSWDSPL